MLINMMLAGCLRSVVHGEIFMADEHGPNSCVTCPRRQLTEWRNLETEHLELVNRHKHDRILKPGEILFNQGDESEGIYCVKDGLVGERRFDAEGHSILVRLNHPGTTVGYQELLSKTPFRNSAEVLQDSHICFINKSIVQQLIEGAPSVGQRFLRRSLKDAQDLEGSFVEVQTISVKARLLHVLMIFYERYGRLDPDVGHVFDIPVARQDLAALVGAAPETISRTTRQLQADGLVQFPGVRKAIIPDLDLVFDAIGADT